MKNFSGMDVSDFYFNGHWLSEFSGKVGGRNGLSPLSTLPQKAIRKEEVIGRHGAIVYGADYNPRTFTVPVYFENLKGSGDTIRDIAGWLNTDTDVDFYYKNDTVKIKCQIDSAVDMEQFILTYGMTELKFIAHDPFYYAITDTYSSYTTTLTTTKTFVNAGNMKSYPKIQITGSGNVTITFNGVDFTVNAISSYATVDGLYLTCYKDTTNKINDFSGAFPELLIGNNTIVVKSGTVTKLEVWNRDRWI